jgi:DNA-directed RNA polymerase specialized sigma24 family protein
MSLPRSPRLHVSDSHVSNTYARMHEQFNMRFCEIIKSTTATNRIDWLLAKYRIQDEVEVGDIICESYSRGIENLQAEKSIINIHGWFRSTSHNIIREKFRAKGRNKKLTDRLSQEHECIYLDRNSVSCAAEYSQINELWDRLKQLKPLERKILTLQAQGRSMKQIAIQLVQDGDCPDRPNVISNITKRASRARKQLRESS